MRARSPKYARNLALSTRASPAATINAAVEDTSGRSYAGVITAAYNDVQEEAGGEYQTEVIWNGQTRYAKCSAETYALIAELYESLPTQE